VGMIADLTIFHQVRNFRSSNSSLMILAARIFHRVLIAASSSRPEHTNTEA
jgi:hypothetical protein